MTVLTEKTLDKFKLELYKASLGTHTNDKAKREFMLSLYDIRIKLINNRDIDLVNFISEITTLLTSTRKEYSDVPMPEYFEATIWVLTH